ncbi:hypothetical protein E2C01_055840 [Portunus trituberculatus]|uniref:Uncharacterized protein n=1 Tax=Portunus trituberculatus TaxID=210409 RepID=A0A5B7GYR9_PORTR|nr:hypothetical protein [Portunus trituberculatus]
MTIRKPQRILTKYLSVFLSFFPARHSSHYAAGDHSALGAWEPPPPIRCRGVKCLRLSAARGEVGFTQGQGKNEIQKMTPQSGGRAPQHRSTAGHAAVLVEERGIQNILSSPRNQTITTSKS